MSSTSIHTMLLVGIQHMVTWAAFLVTHFIGALQWGSQHFPNATRVVEGVVFAYMIWRSYVRIIKFWWRFFKFLVKVCVFYLAVVLVLGMYIRGVETFLVKDMAKVWSLAKYMYQRVNIVSEDNGPSYVEPTYFDPTAGGENPIMNAASSFLYKNKDTIDAMEEKFHEAKHHAEDYIKGASMRDKMKPKLENVYDFAANLGLF